MPGGFGGSQTTEVKVPEWMEDAAKSNLARADKISQIGYVPYYGPDVAALNPMQTSAMQNTSDWAQQFGMQSSMPQMPQAQDFGGMQAYSSAPLYEQAVAELQARRPSQYAQMQNLFVDPIKAAPAQPQQPAQNPAAQPASPKYTPKDADYFDWIATGRGP